MEIRKLRRGGWLSTLLVALLLMVGCKSSTGPDDPTEEPEEYTKEITAIDSETEETLDEVTFSIDGDIIGEETEKVSVTREENTSETIQAARDGYEDGSRSVSFNDNSSVQIPLDPKESDTEEVKITYDVIDADADSLVAATLTFEGKTVAESKAEGSFSLPSSEDAGDLCGEALYFQDNCLSLTPNKDQEITVELTREAVEVSVEVRDDNSEEIISEAEISVDGESIGSGSASEEFKARAGDRDISASADGYEDGETSISADEDHFVTLYLEKDEELKGTRVEHGIYFDDQQFVSGKEGEQEIVLIGSYVNDFPASIQSAVSISVQFTVLVSDEETSEFALRFRTGPNDDNLNTVNTTETVTVNGTGDWQEITIPISKDYFENGTAYAIDAIHLDGSKVIFFEAERDDYFIIEWWYEP